MVRVEEFMSKGVITIDAAEMAVGAAELMTEKGIGSLVVTRDGEPVGIVTESDFIRKVTSKKLDASVLRVHEIMSKPLITVSADTNVKEAARLMREKRIRRLPVVRRGRLVGIVTSSDFTWLYR